MTEAKPCIVCDKHLENVDSDADNQPYKGTYFRSHGAYGSTAFDPMDGSFIEINVCDECLLKARDKGEVMYGREAKPVFFDGAIVGFIPTSGHPLTDWTGEEDSALFAKTPDDGLFLDVDDLRNAGEFPAIKWNITPEELLQMAEAEDA